MSRIIVACFYCAHLVNLAYAHLRFASPTKESHTPQHKIDNIQLVENTRGITALQLLMLSAFGASPKSASAESTPRLPLQSAWRAFPGWMGDKPTQSSVYSNRKRDVLRDMSPDEHEQFFRLVADDCDAIDFSSSERERFDAFLQCMRESRDGDFWQLTDDGQSAQSQHFYPGLAARPVWCREANDDGLEWLRKLEKQAPVIAAELRAVCDAELPAGYEYDVGEKSAPLDGVVGLTATEKEIYVPGFDEHPENGYIQTGLMVNNEKKKVSELFPRTMAAIDACGVRTGVRLVAFGKQLPHTALNWHSDGRNFMLTAHLPLAGPSKTRGDPAPPFGSNSPHLPSEEVRKGAAGMVMAPLRFKESAGTMQDNAVPRSWQPPSSDGVGNGVVFDTSFLHSAFNDGDEVADILFIDFFHPDLSDAEVEAIRCLQRRLQNEGERRASLKAA